MFVQRIKVRVEQCVVQDKEISSQYQKRILPHRDYLCATWRGDRAHLKLNLINTLDRKMCRIANTYVFCALSFSL